MEPRLGDVPSEISDSQASRERARRANEECLEVLRRSEPILRESEKRIPELEQTLTQSKARTVEAKAKIRDDWKDVEGMKYKVQEHKSEQKALMGDGSFAGASVGMGWSSYFCRILPCCSCSKLKRIVLGIGAFTTIVIIVYFVTRFIL